MSSSASLSTSSILSELRSPTSAVTQLNALRALKHDVIGHDQNKGKWIGLGVASLLGMILRASCTESSMKAISLSGTISRSQLLDGEACLQAIITIGSLAQGKLHTVIKRNPKTDRASGGPRFLRPLKVAQIFPTLLSLLGIEDCSPAVVSAALKTLNTIADCAALEDTGDGRQNDSFADTLYNDTNMCRLATLLHQKARSSTTQSQISLTATLLSKTCRREHQREMLASTGILEALAIQLASVVETSRAAAVSRDVEDFDDSDKFSDTPKNRLAPLLHATACIISDSKNRASQLVCAPAFTGAVSLPSGHPRGWRPPLGPEKPTVALNSPSHQSLPLSSPKSLGATSTLPPFNHLATLGKQHKNGRFNETSPFHIPNGQMIVQDDDTILVGWLLNLVRTQPGLTRLMATWMLALLYRAGLISLPHQRGLGMLVTPMMARMLENDATYAELEPCYDYGALQTPHRLIKEIAPRIIALMVVESPDLQRAAVDAGVVKRLSQLLKQTFDALPTTNYKNLWTPQEPSADSESSRSNSSVTLGSPGLSPALFHTLQVRESVLIALAAMASSNDEYRKAIIDNGVVPFVVESLKPNASSASAGAGLSATSAKLVNSTSVLLAACATAQALSRSVSTLRTSLMDAGLASPLTNLLKSPFIEVQTAATAVVANIVLEFSPMREVNGPLSQVFCLKTNQDPDSRPSSKPKYQNYSANMPVLQISS